MNAAPSDAPRADDPLADELRRRLGEQWAGQPVDRDRLFGLLGLVDDPCRRATLGRLTLLERLYLVCDRQLEAGLWNAAFRSITTIDRWERRLAQPASLPGPMSRPVAPPAAPPGPSAPPMGQSERIHLIEMAFIASQRNRDAIPACAPVPNGGAAAHEGQPPADPLANPPFT